MTEINRAVQKVETGRVYNVSEMRRLDLFPWISNRSNTQSSYISAILDDKFGDNLLRVRITGSGRGREYRIKGENIIKYLRAKSHGKKENAETEVGEKEASQK